MGDWSKLKNFKLLHIFILNPMKRSSYFDWMYFTLKFVILKILISQEKNIGFNNYVGYCYYASVI